MRKVLALADRTAVLFLGIAAGAAIGFAFGRGGEKPAPRPALKPAVRTAPAPAAPAEAAGFECALPFQQHLLETVAAGRPVKVGVFGDSFGDGVWSALYRLLPAQEQYRVLKYSQQSTGFTRYSSLDLEEHARQQLADDGPIDVAVISFGANDTQGVYSGGHAAALMSPEWQRVIGARVDRFVALMRDRGAIVYWVGLPKMRATAFDDDISAMNDFYAARMKALGVPFIDIKPLTVDGAGEFALYLPDPVSHERRLLRANDGVHMSMNGYVVITRALASRIKAYVAAARVVATGGTAPVVPAAPAKPAEARDKDKPRRPEAKEADKQDKTDKRRGEGKDKSIEPTGRTSEEREKPASSPKRDEGDREKSSEPSRRDRDDKGDNSSSTRRDERDKSNGPARPQADKDRTSTPAKRDAEPRDRPAASEKHDAGDKAVTPRRASDDKAKPADAPRSARPEHSDKKSDKTEKSDASKKPRRRDGDAPSSTDGNSQ